MKTVTLLIAPALLVAALSASVAAQRPKDEQRERGLYLPPGMRIGVTVLDQTGGNQVDRVVGDMLTTALRRAGVRVIERPAIDAIVKEQNLVRNGVVDPDTAVPAGKVLGVDYLLGVKATEFGVKDDRVGGAIALGPVAGVQVRTSTARVVLDARLLDVATGAVMTATTAEGRQVTHGGTLLGGFISGRVINLGGIDIGSKEWSESSLGKAARKAVGVLVGKLGGSMNAGDGLILAALPEGEAVIGLGSFDGLRKGDHVTLIRMELIRDSKGRVVWSDERHVGRMRITEVRGDRARARMVESTGAAQEGDIVRSERGRAPTAPAREESPEREEPGMQ